MEGCKVMNYSNFEFLKCNFSELYHLAKDTEDWISTDSTAAMTNIQQIMRNVIHYIIGNTGLATRDLHMDGVIHYLWKNKLIADHMYVILREIELFDSRESEMLIDPSNIEHYFYRMHDFTVWFYKTYVDDAFVPNAFINPFIKESSPLVMRQETEIELTAPQMIKIDGTVHKSEWVDSLKKLDNYVIINYENGERYEGQITKKMKHGRGIYTWVDGTVYIGYWRHDLEHGYGEKLYANGDIYRGYWKNGAFEAQGTYVWKNGQSYEGQWKDGLEHGYGIKTTAKGIKTRGFWTYGEFGYLADQLNDASN